MFDWSNCCLVGCVLVCCVCVFCLCVCSFVCENVCLFDCRRVRLLVRACVYVCFFVCGAFVCLRVLLWLCQFVRVQLWSGFVLFCVALTCLLVYRCVCFFVCVFVRSLVRLCVCLFACLFLCVTVCVRLPVCPRVWLFVVFAFVCPCVGL